MQIGILFPQTEIGIDPGGLREYAQAIVQLGFDHLVTYEHVLGAIPERLPPDYKPFGVGDEFHEPMSLFAFLAACVPKLGLATSILVLPQRQTPLVAKQAVQLDMLTGEQFRLGVGIGWNFAEFEAMGTDFKTRASRFEEQIEVLRLLWTQDVVNFHGRFHHIDGCGLKPRPRRSIPIWIGGRSEPALRRAAVLGDGFLPLQPLAGGWEATLDRMRTWREEAGKSWTGFGIEARVAFAPGWGKEADVWRERGASHVYVSTMGHGQQGAAAHIELLRRIAAER